MKNFKKLISLTLIVVLAFANVNVMATTDRPDTIAGSATVYDNGMNSKSDSVYGEYEARFINLVDGDMATYFSAVTGWKEPALVFDKAYDVLAVEIISNAPITSDNMNKCYYTTDGSMATSANSNVTIASTTDLGNGTYRIIYDFSAVEGKITSIAFQPYPFSAYDESTEEYQPSQIKMYELNVVEERTITRPDTIAGRGTVYPYRTDLQYDQYYGTYNARPVNMFDGDLTTAFSPAAGRYNMFCLGFDKAYELDRVEVIASADYGSYNILSCYYSTTPSTQLPWQSGVKSVGSPVKTNLDDGKVKLTYDFSTVTGEWNAIGFDTQIFSGDKVVDFKIYEIEIIEKKKRPDTIAGRATVYDNGMNSASDSVYGEGVARFINLVDGDMATYFSAVTGWKEPALVFDKAYDVLAVEIISNAPITSDNMNKCYYTTDGSMATSANSNVTIKSTTDLGNGTYRTIYDFSAVEGTITSIAFEPYSYSAYDASTGKYQPSQIKMYELNVVEERTIARPDTIAGRGTVYPYRTDTQYDQYYGTYNARPVNMFDGDLTTAFSPAAGRYNMFCLGFDKAYELDRVEVTVSADYASYNILSCYYSTTPSTQLPWQEGVKSVGSPVKTNLDDGKVKLTYDFSAVTGEWNAIGFDTQIFSGDKVVDFKIYEINVVEKPDTIAGKGTALSMVADSNYDSVYGEAVARPANMYDSDITTYFSPVTGWNLTGLKFDRAYGLYSVEVITNASPANYNAYNMRKCFYSDAPSTTIAWDVPDSYVVYSTYTDLGNGMYSYTYDFSSVPGAWNSIGFEPNLLGSITEGFEGLKIFEVNVYSKNSYYVSPQGNDSNNGTTAETPFKTIEKAKSVVREACEKLTQNITIYLMDGVHTLEDTLYFDDRDGGNDEYNVKYCAYTGSEPIISGGKKVEDWVQDGNIWSADLDVSGIDYFRELYINDRRAIRASTNEKVVGIGWYDDPNYAVFSNPTTEEQETINMRDGIIVDSSVLGVCKNPSQMELHWDISWMDNRCVVSDVIDLGNGQTAIRMKQPNFYQILALAQFAPSPDIPFYIENAKEILDTEGEFYYDSQARKIYYYPHEFENMITAEVYVPILEKIIDIRGRDAVNRINNLSFDGLTFAHATWLLPSTQGKFGGQAERVVSGADQLLVPGNITVNYAKNLKVTNNVFRGLGSVALQLEQGVDNSIIDGNIFEDIGDSAITVGHYDGETEEIVEYDLAWGKEAVIQDGLWLMDLKDKYIISSINIDNSLVKVASNKDLSDLEAFSPESTKRYRYVVADAENIFGDVVIKGYKPVVSNLSYNKEAISSSLPENANNANNDIIARECGWASSSNDTNPWWMVDLGAEYPITDIEIVASQDTNQDNFKNFIVECAKYSDFSDATDVAEITENIEYNGTHYIKINNKEKYRYVRIRKTDSEALKIGQFRVFGIDNTTAVSVERDIVYKKNVWSSSNAPYMYWGTSVNAYDGNAAWWAVDLLEPQKIENIAFNAMENETFRIEGSNSKDFSKAEVISSSEKMDSNGVCSVISEGNYRYVRIIADIGSLHFNSVSINAKKPQVICRDNVISNNYIIRAGAEHWQACGITAFYTENLKIINNTLKELPYTGINIGWGWTDYPDSRTCRNNLVAYNRIENVMQECCDGGGIYTLGNMRGTIIRGNYIKNSDSIYCALPNDAGSAYIYICDNVLENGLTNMGQGTTHEYIYAQNNYATSPTIEDACETGTLESMILYDAKNPSAAVSGIINNSGIKSEYHKNTYKSVGTYIKPFGRTPYSNLRGFFTVYVPNNVSGTKSYIVKPVIDYVETVLSFRSNQKLSDGLSQLKAAYNSNQKADELITLAMNLREQAIDENNDNKVNIIVNTDNTVILSSEAEKNIYTNLFIAGYDNNMLTKIDSKNAFVPMGGYLKISADVFSGARIFAWDNNMKPLSDALSVD